MAASPRSPLKRTTNLSPIPAQENYNYLRHVHNSNREKEDQNHFSYSTIKWFIFFIFFLWLALMAWMISKSNATAYSKWRGK